MYTCLLFFSLFLAPEPVWDVATGLVGSQYEDQVGLVQQGWWSHVVYNFRMDWRSGNFELRYFCECNAVLSGSENSARGVHAHAFMRRDVRLDVLRILGIRYGHGLHHHPGIRKKIFVCVHTRSRWSSIEFEIQRMM